MFSRTMTRALPAAAAYWVTSAGTSGGSAVPARVTRDRTTSDIRRATGTRRRVVMVGASPGRAVQLGFLDSKHLGRGAEHAQRVLGGLEHDLREIRQRVDD